MPQQNWALEAIYSIFHDGTFFLVEWAEYWKLETALTRSLAADVIQIIKVTFEQGIREGDGRCKR